MSDRPKFFEDLAGVAGGAISALAGLREETEAAIRARVDETIRHLQLVRRDELEAVTDLAANARAGQEAAELKLAASGRLGTGAGWQDCKRGVDRGRGLAGGCPLVADRSNSTNPAEPVGFLIMSCSPLCHQHTVAQKD
jgi:BMFP domain-containing protein YqiC